MRQECPLEHFGKRLRSVNLFTTIAGICVKFLINPQAKNFGLFLIAAINVWASLNKILLEK